MTNSSFKELQQRVHSLILVFAAMTMCFYGVNYHTGYGVNLIIRKVEQRSIIWIRVRNLR
jgi:hypothetical protein